jgi:protein-S-isoprenylcysteine O-methyltransferase Ste14
VAPKRRILPPVWLLLALIAMASLHRYWPIARVFAPPVNSLGAVPLGLGIVMIASSALAFRRAGTAVIPFEQWTALVTTGWYRYTRNPMYLGLALVLVGAAFLFGTASPWLPIPVFVWIIRARFIAGEEQFLTGIFGDEYRSYASRVRRWI